MLELYYKKIDVTNEKIGKGLSWTEYAKKFKEVNPDLFRSLQKVELIKVKNQYLRNWIKNLRSEE